MKPTLRFRTTQIQRIICVIVVIVLFSTFPVCAIHASYPTNYDYSCAQVLYDSGLFKGTGTNPDGTPNFDLDRTPTRHEAVTMLVRLLGKETEAQSGKWILPFDDVAEWARPYVGYAYYNHLTTGTSATTFGGDAEINAAQYLTFVLRALGYTSGTDFQWDAPWVLSDQIGLTKGEYSAETKEFTRGDVAIISLCSMSVKPQTSTNETPTQNTANNSIPFAAYADYPEIPDYGAMFGLTPTKHYTLGADTEDSVTYYVYDLKEADYATAIRTPEYGEALKGCGFTYAGSISEDAIMYQSSHYKVTFILTVNMEVFISINKLKGASSYGMYDQVPDIPDFGAMFGITPYYTDADKDSYTFAYSALKVDAADRPITDYYDRLEALGAKYQYYFESDEDFVMVFKNPEHTVSVGISPDYGYIISIEGNTGSSSPSSSSSTHSSTTLGEQNALKEANDYLRVMAFSRTGLIEQLEFDGYTRSEATYAVDHCDANWNEQAVRCAADYLRTMGFSRKELIEQLEFEGFTHSQAVYGVEQNGY